MAAATITGSCTSTFARTILRSPPSIRTATPIRPSQASVPTNGFVPSNFSLRCPARLSPAPSSIRSARVDLSTLVVPLHRALSTACLVSRLPTTTDASVSIQGFSILSFVLCVLYCIVVLEIG